MSRFVNLNDGQIEELIDSKDSASTKKVVVRGKTLFLEYAATKGYTEENVSTLSAADIDQLLFGFYPSVRNKDGDLMKLNSLKTLRYGIAAYLRDIGHDIYDVQFQQSKKSYDATATDLKKKGKASVDHKVPISPVDIKKLYSTDHHTFDTDTPVGLQNKVFFELMFHICRRGRENLRQMTKTTFAVRTDSEGVKYVVQITDELDKNHRGNTSDHDNSGEGRMYATGGKFCPVLSYEKYISKLTDIEELWQRPLDSYIPSDQVWYCKAPVGKNTLNTFMARMSKTAGLSYTYTNHCIRATCITILDDAGIEARHIMRVSGHRNESSIRSYSTRLSEDRKRSISATISKRLIPDRRCDSDEVTSAIPCKKRIVPSSTVSKPGDVDFDEETDLALSQMSIPAPSIATTNVSKTTNCECNSMQFNNCQVTININK
jgi:integrase